MGRTCRILAGGRIPELISLGERCIQWGFIFLWNGPKQPIFISPDLQYIIILDVDHSVPIWGPHMERSDKFLGTFNLLDNLFDERCGVYINDAGELCIRTDGPLCSTSPVGRACPSLESSPEEPPSARAEPLFPLPPPDDDPEPDVEEQSIAIAAPLAGAEPSSGAPIIASDPIPEASPAEDAPLAEAPVPPTLAARARSK